MLETHRPGGVVIFGSHVVHSPRQYAWLCATWNGSSLGKGEVRYRLVLERNCAYHVGFPDDAVDLFEDQNSCYAEENVKRRRRRYTMKRGGHIILSQVTYRRAATAGGERGCGRN